MAREASLGTALITGASSGIGAVYADRLARRGYDLVLVARDGERLAKLAETLARDTGVSVDTLRADLTVKSDLAAVEARLRSDQTLSLLINNAGIAAFGGFTELDVEHHDAMAQLNIVALTRLAAAAGANFAARQTGVIVNLASVLALMPDRSGPVYAGSKAYVLAFTESLAAELGPKGVRLQVVLPGATRTEIFDRAGASVDAIPAEYLMEVDAMVDAALVGFDRGELVTIPSLPDIGDWDAFLAARAQLAPNLSRNRPADRYLSAGA
ncbi:MAG TPA: SDR family oxidoreductase [Caulobacteraceae bacterium]